MILHLSGEIDYKMMDELVKQLTLLKSEERLIIYFTCPEGGLTDVGIALIDIINKNKDIIDMTYYGELFSAGMNVFLGTKCTKKLLSDTRGMFHFSWQQMDISEGGKPTSAYDIFSMKEMKRSKEKTIEFLKTTKLNEKEISSIRRGKDIYFSYERMLEII